MLTDRLQKTQKCCESQCYHTIQCGLKSGCITNEKHYLIIIYYRGRKIKSIGLKWIFKIEYRIQKTEDRRQNTEYRIQNTEYRRRETENRMRKNFRIL